MRDSTSPARIWTLLLGRAGSGLFFVETLLCTSRCLELVFIGEALLCTSHHSSGHGRELQLFHGCHSVRDALEFFANRIMVLCYVFLERLD